MKEKHTMRFVASDSRSIDMDLCCFCARTSNLIRPVACPYYEDDFEGTSCVGLKKVDNISLRIEMLLNFMGARQDATETESTVIQVMPNSGEKMDIFEKLKNAIGCSYVSDLCFEPYRTEAQKLLKTMELERCSIAELNDIANYFYKKHFDTADAAICFLKG